MFRTVPLSIIRSFSLYTQQWFMSYRFADSLRAGSVPSWSCSQAVSKPVRHIPLLRVQWKTLDDGQRNCPKHVEFYCKNKFEKLVHLVGLIIRNYHDARSPERQRIVWRTVEACGLDSSVVDTVRWGLLWTRYWRVSLRTKANISFINRTTINFTKRAAPCSQAHHMTGFNPRPGHVGFVVDKVGIGTGFLPSVLRLSPVSIIVLILCTYSFIAEAIQC